MTTLEFRNESNKQTHGAKNSTKANSALSTASQFLDTSKVMTSAYVTARRPIKMIASAFFFCIFCFCINKESTFTNPLELNKKAVLKGFVTVMHSIHQSLDVLRKGFKINMIYFFKNLWMTSSLSSAMYGRLRYFDAKSRPYPTTNFSPISNPLHLTGTSTLRLWFGAVSSTTNSVVFGLLVCLTLAIHVLGIPQKASSKIVACIRCR